MKNLSILALLIVVFASCDNRFDGISNYNKPPFISFSDKKTTSTEGTITVADSMKTSFKQGKSKYDFTITTGDENANIQSVNATIVSATGTASAAILYLGSNIITGPIVQPGTGGPLTFTIHKLDDTDGAVSITVSVVDAFGASANFILNLVTFKNLLPVAKVTVTLNNVNGDPYEYLFSGKASFDGDKRFENGGIQAYNWVINGVKLAPINVAEIGQVFPGPGGYQVSLSVTDSDGGTSPVVSTTITVK